MKIYANKRQLNLDSLVGKDIWVKVETHMPFYIRILSKTESELGGPPWYRVNAIPAYQFRGTTYMHGERNFDKYCNNVHDLSGYIVNICYPVEMFTTDDIEVM